MSRRNKDKGRLAPFVPLFRHTIKTAAWRALSAGARATFFALKTNYNTYAQNAVFLSARDGAKELGVCKDTVCKWVHELEHYGFIVEVQGAHLGVSGTGKAAHYRLTDCRFAGQPPTYDFQNWNGVLYDPQKQNLVGKTRTPRPKKSDIRAKAGTTLNGNKCPKKPDIRTAGECPKKPDITSLTNPRLLKADGGAEPASVADHPSPMPETNPVLTSSQTAAVADDRGIQGRTLGT
jgi:hypothetical protein